MRPAADRKDAHDVDLQGDNGACGEAHSDIKREARAGTELQVRLGLRVKGPGDRDVARVVHCVSERPVRPNTASLGSRRARGQSDSCGDPALVILRADYLFTLKLGERNEWNDPTAVDVGSGYCHLPIGGLVLDDFQNPLSAWRPDRNDHDSARLQLLQERRRNVIDAAGDDDLVKRRRLFPSIIAVGGLALDGLELFVTV